MDDNKAKVRSFLSRFIRTNQLNDEDDIFGLGFVNSLFAMQLVTWLEKEFLLEVKDEDLDIRNFNSINALVNFIEQKKSVSLEA